MLGHIRGIDLSPTYRTCRPALRRESIRLGLLAEQGERQVNRIPILLGGLPTWCWTCSTLEPVEPVTLDDRAVVEATYRCELRASDPDCPRELAKLLALDFALRDFHAANYVEAMTAEYKGVRQ